MRTCTLITFALALAPVAAHAQTQMQRAPAVGVKTSDINLQSPAGRALLSRRVNAAAVNVCQPLVSSTLLLQPAVIKCRAAAVRDSQSQVTALVQRRTTLASR